MDVINNVNKQRFELEINGEIAYIDYDMAGSNIRLNYTEVPESMKGKGIGSKLADQTFSLIGGMNMKVIPDCHFIQHWLTKHPEKREMVVENE
ncbi:MAG: N-acetyltransferase [Bacteroidales bacterium]|nr:N-acetyltransferase [Bacteroidales bacterium]